ncbi:MAG: hypothetical protein IJC99_04900 [Clostridia bacterium]|nr:hypothetical protein [Clostridia bacterium]
MAHSVMTGKSARWVLAGNAKRKDVGEESAKPDALFALCGAPQRAFDVYDLTVRAPS